MVVRQLALQGSSFRGHDESETSMNPGNVLGWIGFAAKLNEQIRSVVLGNAPGNAKYTSPSIQKEILGIIANRIRRKIREDIGDSCFSILVDEAADAAGREQMSIILRFVNSRGIVTERFFSLRSVPETSAKTLKQEICDVLSEYNLQVDKLRGQGYDGAINMSGQFNGLRALFLKDCPYAYFVHCFAHRLQLALVTSTKFFSLLDCIINVVKSSPKRIRELQTIHKRDLDGMLDTGEIQSGQGSNQMTSLKRSGPTRWGSHYHSILSIITMFNATCEVLKDVSTNCTEGPSRAQARGASKNIGTFEFAFNLHMMKAIMEMTNFLCQTFQQESVDIVATIGFVSLAKTKLQQLRDEGWDKLLEEVRSFCLKHA
ncbi:Zinc finger MYM-type protein 1 [Linum perenne]